MKPTLSLNVGRVGFIGCAKSANLFQVRFEISNESPDAFKVVPDSSQGNVTTQAQKTPNFSRVMAMINVQLSRRGAANSATPLLHGVQISVLLNRHAVTLAQTLRAILVGCASLLGVLLETPRLLFRSTLVALPPAAITVARANAKLINRFRATASAACFNSKSHDTTASLIGQRPGAIRSRCPALSL